MNRRLGLAVVLLGLAACGADGDRLAAAPDDTGLAGRVLRQAGYPPAPALRREVARLIRELNALCPHFPPAAIARDLVRRYQVPWLHVEAQAQRVGMRPEAYGLFMLRVVHGTMLLDARHTDCGGR